MCEILTKDKQLTRDEHKVIIDFMEQTYDKHFGINNTEFVLSTIGTDIDPDFSEYTMNYKNIRNDPNPLSECLPSASPSTSPSVSPRASPTASPNTAPTHRPVPSSTPTTSPTINCEDNPQWTRESNAGNYMNCLWVGKKGDEKTKKRCSKNDAEENCPGTCSERCPTSVNWVTPPK